KEKKYRIGSFIVHDDVKKDNGEGARKLNIVDGQQRLTTISILLFHLKYENVLLLTQNYKHKISKDNITYNSRLIQNWLKKISDIENFKNQLLEKSEFVLFTVYDQDEAFQLFDSQNARGKSLEPYDLLKAFHLREMEFDSEEDKANAVARWEESVDNGTLKPILANHLFKIRKWVRNELKYNFTKDNIDEFKGISLYQKQQYPYETSLRMLDGFVENAQNDKFLKNHHIAQTFPFSITMPIINGKRFFEYIDYYIQLHKSLFPENDHDIKDSTFKKFYWDYTRNYHGAGRTGDWKVRNLYENLLLLYRDKFGEHDFKSFYTAFYKAVYTIRCNNKAIRVESILNSKERKILQEINESITPQNLKYHQYFNYKITEPKNGMASGLGFIKKYINNEQ